MAMGGLMLHAENIYDHSNVKKAYVCGFVFMAFLFHQTDSL